MGYKEYIAEEGSVVVNLFNFIYGISITCSIDADLDVFSVKNADIHIIDETVAESDKYKDSDERKSAFLEKVAYIGYDITKRVEPIIHELK